MKKVIFPYRTLDNIDIPNDGSIFRCPAICKKNKEECRSFYRNITEDKKLMKCPFGYYVQGIQISGHLIFCIGMKIVSDSKLYDSKRLFGIHGENNILRSHYQILMDMLITNSVTDDFGKFEEIDEQKNIIDDTVHEVRRINRQLVPLADRIEEFIEKYNWEDQEEKYIKDVVKTLDGNTNLLSLRLDMFDISMNPGMLDTIGKKDIPIYKKFEKVYKCLYVAKSNKKIDIQMKGSSYGLFNGFSMIEIAIFIVLENAIKYSPENNIVNITFEEDQSNGKLCVFVENIGPSLSEDELCKITERGYRGSNALMLDVDGQGLGLNMLKTICEKGNVGLSFDSSTKKQCINGLDYSTFTVTFEFKNMIF